MTRRLLHSVGSTVPLEPRAGRIEIRVLIDRLSIETYGNHGEVSVTSIAYQRDTDPHLTLSATGGEARIVSLTVHPLKSIWR